MKWSPDEYANAAVVAQDAAAEMMMRLALMTVAPRVVVDVGCGTSDLSLQLLQHFPNARIFAVDQSDEMVAYAKAHLPASISVMQAYAHALPFDDRSVDVITLNLLLPWVIDVEAALKECLRVLAPNGVLLLSALGVDTLREYHAALDAILAPRLIDMHDVGDLLVRAGFADPVLDVNHITVSYRTQEKLLADLFYSEMLTEEAAPCELQQDAEGKWSVTYEVIQAHAWVPAVMAYERDAEGVTRVPLSALRETLRKAGGKG